MSRNRPILLAALLAVAVTAPAAAFEGVSDLKLTMPKGAPPATVRPLLHGDVLVVPETATSLAALDAATGAPLWHYQDAGTPGARGNALLAFSDDLLVLATPDARLIGLDLHSGRLRWQAAAAEGAGEEAGRYRYQTPPLIAGGRVVAPIAGCDPEGPQGCWVAAYEAETGVELWRSALDPHPDGQPATGQVTRAGGTATAAVSWAPPIYDPETDTLFVGLSGPGPGGRSVVTYALDAGTGTVLWVRRQNPTSAAELRSAAVELKPIPPSGTARF